MLNRSCPSGKLGTVSLNPLRQRVLGSSWLKEDPVRDWARGREAEVIALGGGVISDTGLTEPGAPAGSACPRSSAPCWARLPKCCPADQLCSSLTRHQSQRPPCEFPKVLLWQLDLLLRAPGAGLTSLAGILVCLLLTPWPLSNFHFSGSSHICVRSHSSYLTHSYLHRLHCDRQT